MEDRFGHRISYLRVSITDRCNERCTYCMPQELQEWLPRQDILTFEETLRLIRIASELGVTKIRLTGGEPLTRRDVMQLFRQAPAPNEPARHRSFHQRHSPHARSGARPDDGGSGPRLWLQFGQHLARYARPRGVCAHDRARSFAGSNRRHRRGHRGRISPDQNQLRPDARPQPGCARAAGRFRGGAKSSPPFHRVDAGEHDRGPDRDQLLPDRRSETRDRSEIWLA